MGREDRLARCSGDKRDEGCAEWFVIACRQWRNWISRLDVVMFGNGYAMDFGAELVILINGGLSVGGVDNAGICDAKSNLTDYGTDARFI